LSEKREAIAFLSYVRSDDDHDSGRISELRQRLEGEVKMQTGLPFCIFQDRNDIHWGQQWKERIEEALLGATLLIPVVTPSFFRSHACRAEFSTFLLREKQLGENQLILPIYYVAAPQIESMSGDDDELVSAVKSRNWADWRGFRFDPLSDPKIRAATSVLAGDIVRAITRLKVVTDADQDSEKSSQIERPEASAATGPIDTSPQVQNLSVAKEHLASKRKATPYKIYTTEFDEVIRAAELLDDSTALAAHSFLLKRIRHELGSILTSDLQELITAARRSNATSRVCVTILLDNSGSLRGEPIQAIAAASSLASRLLSEAGIPNEVLGYTTRAWKGGQSREQWLANGRPLLPGRLNDLRHIVYKDFSQTFQEADIGFSAMLTNGILKENIDGEALPWAASRGASRSEPRKILLVVSDGAPVDDSTLSVNPKDILHKHLMESISTLRASKEVELYGFGLDYNVSRYFGPSPSSSVQFLCQDFLRAITLLFSDSWSKAAQEIKRSPD
jgi:cobaltochelatase CobT